MVLTTASLTGNAFVKTITFNQLINDKHLVSTTCKLI